MEPQMNTDAHRFDKRQLISVFVCVHLWFCSGCSSHNGPTTRPSARERQEQALHDPFGYSPDMSPADTDVSGGKINEYDRKAMRKDIDHVLNP